MSLLGTLASALGGGFIGVISSFYDLFYISTNSSNLHTCLYVLYFISLGIIYGLLGSLIDSILGATMQATYYSIDRKCIIKHLDESNKHDKNIILICGKNILTNELVNLLSLMINMCLSVLIAPKLYSYFQSLQ